MGWVRFPGNTGNGLRGGIELAELQVKGFNTAALDKDIDAPVDLPGQPGEAAGQDREERWSGAQSRISACLRFKDGVSARLCKGQLGNDMGHFWTGFCSAPHGLGVAYGSVGWDAVPVIITGTKRFHHWA